MRCPICDSELIRSIYSKEDMRWDCWNYDKHIYECGLCKLRFLFPQWTEEELNRLYSGYFQQQDFKGHKQTDRVTIYLDKYVKDSFSILEIGCGLGHNVKRLRNKFPFKTIIGIDKDPNVCDGVLIHNLDYRHVHPAHRYDFIYGIQIFEHLNDPLNFIFKINRLLITKGKYLLEIPNSDDPLLTLYKIEEFKKFYNIPHHLFFYNEHNIKLLFEKIGLKVTVTRLQKYGLINHLRWLVFKKPGNFNNHIPILDDIYKLILTKVFKISDTLIIVGEKQ